MRTKTRLGPIATSPNRPQATMYKSAWPGTDIQMSQGDGDTTWTRLKISIKGVSMEIGRCITPTVRKRMADPRPEMLEFEMDKAEGSRSRFVVCGVCASEKGYSVLAYKVSEISDFGQPPGRSYLERSKLPPCSISPQSYFSASALSLAALPLPGRTVDGCSLRAMVGVIFSARRSPLISKEAMMATPPNARLARYTTWYELQRALGTASLAASKTSGVTPGTLAKPAAFPVARSPSAAGRDPSGRPACRRAEATSVPK